jgi:methylphosphotriester-DNA--protein-cysteine methyltransferase
VTTTPAAATCPTCGQDREPEEFYAGSTECKPCKRDRSQQNRAAAAQKVTVVDRLIEVLERLADQGWKPDALIATNAINEDGPGALERAEAGATRQGVNP